MKKAITIILLLISCVCSSQHKTNFYLGGSFSITEINSPYFYTPILGYGFAGLLTTSWGGGFAAEIRYFPIGNQKTFTIYKKIQLR